MPYHPAPAGGFRWSHSRGSMLEECPHRYYLHYYAYQRRPSPESARIRLLKASSNRYFASGSSLHLAIEWYLKERVAGRANVTAAAFAQMAVTRFENDRIVSRRFVDTGQPPPGPMWKLGKRVEGPKLLVEFLTGEPDRDIDFEERAELLWRSAVGFVETEALSTFKSGAHHPRAVIEDLSAAHLARVGFDVYVKVDLLYPTDDGIDIVDWKSGVYTEEQPNNAQLTAYALWASQQFGVTTDAIRAVTVYLGDGSVVETRLTPDRMQRAVADIDLQIHEMTALHASGMFGDEDDFPKRPKPWCCRGCNFLLICEEGKAVAGHDLTYPGLIHLTPVAAG